MEKKKRSKCKTSHRKVFTVNEANPKEKVIFDFLSTLFNESDTIKDILYEYIVSNNLQTAQHSVNIVQTLGKYSVSNNAKIYNDSVNNNANTCKEIASDSTTFDKDKNISKEDFSIDLNNIEDKEIAIEYDNKEEIEDAKNNALNFLKNGF
ncbi:hypothetical protein FDB52_10230 [Clostridium botulinum]|uniref:hypothetical protein n=1 Tax=Clostridium botulinum TaxID=1491 RepID=UPI0013CA51BE|nr:hypothetical protein [Clostridium botulinum]MBN1042189.1 hypothetical protein [Clostridium botulinum]NFG27735.1 hypothetical protein [Clostridium botulinum]NFN17422.1 hypothetical protein [Clostridium botulinum]NFN48917.1 hypothetical protein [Clostridium botulinum]NFO41779.1 hypothetical protein [Clostridium botulinum]